MPDTTLTDTTPTTDTSTSGSIFSSITSTVTGLFGNLSTTVTGLFTNTYLQLGIAAVGGFILGYKVKSYFTK